MTQNVLKKIFKSFPFIIQLKFNVNIVVFLGILPVKLKIIQNGFKEFKKFFPLIIQLKFNVNIMVFLGILNFSVEINYFVKLNSF